MITQSSTCVIQCQTDGEFQASVQHLAKLALPANARIQQDPDALRITITVDAYPLDF